MALEFAKDKLYDYKAVSAHCLGVVLLVPWMILITLCACCVWIWLCVGGVELQPCVGGRP